MNVPSTPAYSSRRTADLLVGRVSLPGAGYFLTLCEVRRRPQLVRPEVATGIKAALDDLHSAGDFVLQAATVMPDHIHLLGVLGPRLSLSRVVGKFKGATRTGLSAGGFAWQENFYDRRLRHADEHEPFARYLFLNPYRAGLLSLDASWPFWWRWGEVRFGFEQMVAENGRVPSPWLGEPDPDGAADC